MYNGLTHADAVSSFDDGGPHLESPLIYRFNSFHEFLAAYFAVEKTRNARFSYRWLAKKLGFRSHTHLLRIVQGTDVPSPDVLAKLAELCGLSTEDLAFAKALLALQNAASPDERDFCSQKLSELRRDSPATLIAQEAFEMVAQWHHVAIFEMICLPGFTDDPAWIAGRLGRAVTPEQVADSLMRFERLGLTMRTKNGKITRTSDAFTTAHNIPSAAIRSFHRQLLERALAAIDGEPVSRRSLFGHTMPIDSGRMAEAQQLILEFRQRFHAVMSKTGSPDSIYHLAVQLLPLTVDDVG